MPTLTPNSVSKVLVTGANGYIALHVVDQLLKAGYSVRGTVRSQQKTEHLVKTFAEYGNKFEIVVVEDITKEGAFDEAVKGVDAVEHTASPFHGKFDDPQEAIVPAVEGTTSVLRSILKHGSFVKRVVVTSSCAAVLHVASEPKTFTEKDWNEQAPAVVEEQGRAAEVMQKYRASKTLAERAAWKLWNDNKEHVQWDLVTLNPPLVFGPVLHEIGSDPSALNTSMLDWWNSIVKGTKDDATLASMGGAWIDVRDLALAHRLSLEKEKAGGERILISAGSFKWQDWVDAANEVADAYPGLKLPKGQPGAGSGAPGSVHQIQYDVSKAARVLGLGGDIPYHTPAETARDILADAKARGWN